MLGCFQLSTVSPWFQPDWILNRILQCLGGLFVLEISKTLLYCKAISLFRPLLRSGGTIYSNGFFFVQTILADRYIHRGELRLVSLERVSSVEYGIKKILNFVFYKELSRFKLLRK